MARALRLAATAGGALTQKGRVIATSSLRGFLMLYAVAGMKRWRRSHAALRERERRASSNGSAASQKQRRINPQLAVEIAQCQRLVKGYSDTYERACAISAR